MRLPMLPLQTVLLIREMLVHVLPPMVLRPMTLHMLLMRLQLLFVHLRQLMQRQLQIRNQRIAPRPRKVLPHNHPHQLHRLAVRRHRVRRHHPAPFPELMRNSELVELVSVVEIEAESDKGETLAAGLGHEDEAHFLDGEGEVVRCTGQVAHDATIALFAEADELVVLPDDLASASGEVEGEGGLVGAEVVDVEDEFCKDNQHEYKTRWGTGVWCYLLARTLDHARQPSRHLGRRGRTCGRRR